MTHIHTQHMKFQINGNYRYEKEIENITESKKKRGKNYFKK